MNYSFVILLKKCRCLFQDATLELQSEQFPESCPKFVSWREWHVSKLSCHWRESMIQVYYPPWLIKFRYSSTKLFHQSGTFWRNILAEQFCSTMADSVTDSLWRRFFLFLFWNDSILPSKQNSNQVFHWRRKMQRRIQIHRKLHHWWATFLCEWSTRNASSSSSHFQNVRNRVMYNQLS